MGKTSSDEKLLTVRPPKLKNLLYALVFAVLTAAGIWATVLAVGQEPVTVADKVLNCLFFAVSLAFSVFMFSGMADSIRNIFALPTFKVSEEEIFICKYGKASLSELESTELKKNGKVLVFNFKNGTSAVLKSRLSDIPLETAVYAISLRKKQ